MTYHLGNQLIDPALLFEKAMLTPGMHIADFGSGRTGHIVFPAAVIVGDKGIVYAVDVIPAALEAIQKRADVEGLGCIKTVWADLEKPGSVAIPEKTLDAVFMSNLLYHFVDFTVVLNEAKRLLRDKARIVIVDWVRKLGILGPRNDRFVNFNNLIAWARDNSFAVQDQGAMGAYHRYMVLFRHE